MTGQVKVNSQGKVLNTRRIVVTGVLSAIAILLGVTALGFIPVPTAAGNATILHIPAVLGGVLEGPVVGCFVGLIFGITSFLHSPNVFFKDPLVSILPRLFIGVVSYYVYVGIKSGIRNEVLKEWIALPITGFIGSATNTILVLLMIFLRFHWSMSTVLTVAFVNGLPEAIVSAIITTAVVIAYKGITRTSKRSKIS
jgi:uncharacterized membrane protein